MVKYNEDDSIRRNCVGHLNSNKTGKIKVKCFSSAGPNSFSLKPSWNIIYFFHRRHILADDKLPNLLGLSKDDSLKYYTFQIYLKTPFSQLNF